MEDYLTTIVESYSLPSGGQIYDPPISATGTIRSMTVAEEMKRLSPTERPYEMMSSIIEDCLIEKPEISVYDMCMGDYQYLLQRLRVATYGSDYKLSVRCPHCGKVQTVVCDLDSLNTKDYDKESIEGTREFKLPKSGRVVKLKLQTPRINDTIAERVKKISTDYDQSLLVTLESIIDTVDDKFINQAALENMIRKLPMVDVNYLIQKAAKFNASTGVDNTFNVTCEECGEEMIVPFRITSEFFGPEID